MQDTGVPIPILQSPKAHSPKKIKLIIIALLGVVLLVTAGIAVFSFLRNQPPKDIAMVLETIPQKMEAAKADGGYPVTIPASIKATEKVLLSGGGSFDGTSYCITATDAKNSSEQFYVDSSSPNPKSGSCQSSSGTSAPARPGGLSVSFASADQINFAWTASPHAIKYEAECATNSDFSRDVVSAAVVQLEGSCSNLQPGKEYFIRVRGEDREKGTWSDTISAKTNRKPVAPTNLVLKTISSTQIDVSWKGAKNAKLYFLEYATDINFLKNTRTLSVSEARVSITGLKPDTVYYYHVKAVTDDFDANQAPFSAQVWASTQKK